MDSFEDLGLSDPLLEALAAEGIERPTSLQEAAIPVLRRGNNLLLAAGPGAGTLVAWGAALLDRLTPEGDRPRVLVLTSSAENAQRLAESLQRLGALSGHSVAALGSPWVLPGRAQLLFGTCADVLSAVRGGDVDLGSVEAVVVDQADRMEKLHGLAAAEAVLAFLPRDGQRVVTALPVTAGVSDFVERHARRAPVVPQMPADLQTGTPSPYRGTLKYRIVGEPKDEGCLEMVSEILGADARHVLVYCRSEDRAADLGDYLTLHGYDSGAPGDPSVPIWLGVQELEARAAAEGTDGVVVLSHDVPADPDSLDRRHGRGRGGHVLLVPREVSHLRDVSKRTGYKLEPSPPRSTDSPGDLEEFRAALAKAVEDEDVGPYLLLLEPLFERYDPAEIAAAAVALLRRKASPSPAPQTPTPDRARGATPPAWAKLFLSVGERDGLTAKDLVGAITGEAGVPGSAVGKVEIRQSHTVVEVQEPVARKVITALNGTTIRGRAVRADFDRPRAHGGPPRGRSPRRG
ncbi:MAG: DEAD/DEAH box helicase [Gemmatimonadetes bacterium]|nr:DEAD/DEAH box helicase [Gemmatimonadota bacterium]